MVSGCPSGSAAQSRLPPMAKRFAAAAGILARCHTILICPVSSGHRDTRMRYLGLAWWRRLAQPLRSTPAVGHTVAGLALHHVPNATVSEPPICKCVMRSTNLMNVKSVDCLFLYPK
ncbi:hypothetical protein FJTKL_01506 [Diaporthe vaccinii]|uniref:Uncharacterized protein n=1 Tax=Diaporthe vaccinii TaxID=105482 RepID=A0ABR4E0N4_9PEZI